MSNGWLEKLIGGETQCGHAKVQKDTVIRVTTFAQCPVCWARSTRQQSERTYRQTRVGCGEHVQVRVRETKQTVSVGGTYGYRHRYSVPAKS